MSFSTRRTWNIFGWLMPRDEIPQGLELEPLHGAVDDPEQNPPATELRREHFERKTSLMKAAIQGKWEIAEEAIRQWPGLVSDAITQGGETALHLAALEGHVGFARVLMSRMNVGSLKIENKVGDTAFFQAVIARKVEIAAELLQKDAEFINREGLKALNFSVLRGNKEMTDYLFELVTQNEAAVFRAWTEADQIGLLLGCIHSGALDIALKILELELEIALAVAEDEKGETPLLALAKNPSAFRCTRGNTIISYFRGVPKSDGYRLLDVVWDKVLKKEDFEYEQLYKTFTESFLIAAKSENDDFMIEVLGRFPDLLFTVNHSAHNILQDAISRRSFDIFNLSYELGAIKDIMVHEVDKDGNNIVHLVAKLSETKHLDDIPGPALQMQREMLWYKAVEKLVPTRFMTMKNAGDHTPHEVFLEKHEELIKEGEKEIKQIAKACMMVTILITTIVFASAFTMPGGYDEKGYPILIDKESFLLLPGFQVAAMMTSFSSMIIFISLLTSPYSSEDFVKWIPGWFLLGTVLLFVSVVGMMTAFFRSIFVHHAKKKNLAIALECLATALTCIVTALMVCKYPLWFKTLRWSCLSLRLFRSKNRFM